MPAALTVVLVVVMCALPLLLLCRDIASTLRRPIVTGDPPVSVSSAPVPAVQYVASRPVLPLS